MYLKDEEIIEIIVDYVNDDRISQAILIDGKWGTGKTFFIEKKVCNTLVEKCKQYKSIYISLYGIDNTQEILNEIYFELFKDRINKLSDKSGTIEKVSKFTSLISKVANAGAKVFNIEPQDLSEILNELVSCENIVIIFDDIERCDIEINKLLGFINNLTEHNKIKSILIANEEEIGKSKVNKDLPQKYQVALDSRIKYENQANNIECSMQNDVLDKAILKERANELFEEDFLYKKIKEKLIAFTIEYRTDFKDIIEDLIEKYIIDEDTKRYLLSQKDLIIELFYENNHYNIRTLIFVMIAYEKLYCILKNISFDVEEYLDREKEKVLIYTIKSSICIKSGIRMYQWKDSKIRTGFVYRGQVVFGEGVYGYRFVDEYLLQQCLNPVLFIFISFSFFLFFDVNTQR